MFNTIWTTTPLLLLVMFIGWALGALLYYRIMSFVGKRTYKTNDLSSVKTWHQVGDAFCSGYVESNEEDDLRFASVMWPMYLPLILIFLPIIFVGWISGHNFSE